MENIPLLILFSDESNAFLLVTDLPYIYSGLPVFVCGGREMCVKRERGRVGTV